MNRNNTVLESDQSSAALEATRGTPPLPGSMQGIHNFNAAEHPDEHTPSIDTGEHEPLGMYWQRTSSGEMILKPHGWFITDITATADAVFITAREAFKYDTEALDWIEQLAESLRSYVETRTAINQKAGERKIRQETDDAAYQMCQAAKYYMDANERAKRNVERGVDLDSDAQLAKLKEMAETAMREGYILACAVTRASDAPVQINFHNSARRVAEFSAKRLTEWFAKQRTNKVNAQKHQQAGAMLDLSQFFKRTA